MQACPSHHCTGRPIPAGLIIGACPRSAGEGGIRLDYAGENHELVPGFVLEHYAVFGDLVTGRRGLVSTTSFHSARVSTNLGIRGNQFVDLGPDFSTDHGRVDEAQIASVLSAIG